MSVKKSNLRGRTSPRSKAPAGAPTPADGVAQHPPATNFPRVETPSIRIPQPDGSILFRPGKPVVVEDEIGTAEFARRTGISQRHVQYLCDVGSIEARPLTDRPGSKYVIPISEVDRIRKRRDP